MIQINVIDAGHGDCILLEINHSKILIDCGPRSFKIRKKVLASLVNIVGEQGTIDIAIVTHNDDDHIGGFESLLGTGVKINTIIFNSLQDIPEIIKSSQKQISYNQDHDLIKILIEERGTKVLFLTRDSDPLTHNDIKLTAINPTDEILKKMLNNSTAKKERERRKQISSFKKEDITAEEALQIIHSNQDVFTNDTSITNKSSIGLVVEYKSFRGLFLGDAHANDIIEGLKQCGLENSKFDVVKISHHGSERNTNAELLQLIKKTQYVLCANKETNHNHPNSITLARILAFDKAPTIHFSSKSQSLVKNINEFKAINGFNINATYSDPANGINKVCYEHE